MKRYVAMKRQIGQSDYFKKNLILDRIYISERIYKLNIEVIDLWRGSNFEVIESIIFL